MEIFRYAMVIACALVALKLFSVQVLEHGFYSALASGQHEIFQELIPKRGSVFVHDEKDETLVPIATNQQLAFVFADPRLIERPDKTAEAVAEVFDYNDEQLNALKTRLDRPEDPYEPIEKEVDDKTLEKLMSKDLDGILYVRESARIYPDPALGGHLIGFLGSDTNGVKKGRYGIEGFFDGALAGTQGSIRGQRDVAGRLVSLTDRSVEPAIDGADIVLTIDRTIQYMACSMLKQAVTQHGADGGSVVVVEPSTGRVLAMCGAPDFDSNTYGSVDSITQFNNPAIFEAYEPGSIFKPFTMAGAVDSGSVTPTTTFEDVGSAKVDGWPKPIGNAQGKVYGTVNMTQVLEDSINTGMIFSMRQMGQQTFVEYVKRFGFGTLTGIELETELPGNISSLDQSSEIYAATATFGQGITATPIQLVMAYAAIANGGVLKRPQIVDEIRYSEGTVEKRAGQDVTQVIDQKTARTLGAMLVSVIEHGHGKRAGVPGYYIAGKTGTAQVARTDGIGYDEDNTIGSFAGFGPVEDPRFAMVVRIDNPRDVVWAESTAAPLFGKIAEFLLEYFEVEPVRQVDT
jgi:cell division protein FtsI (penicillin-binding protein 3)